jgi:hypothetical protein
MQSKIFYNNRQAEKDTYPKDGWKKHFERKADAED